MHLKDVSGSFHKPIIILLTTVTDLKWLDTCFSNVWPHGLKCPYCMSKLIKDELPGSLHPDYNRRIWAGKWAHN